MKNGCGKNGGERTKLQKRCHGAPDWVIKIVSAGSRSKDYIRKMTDSGYLLLQQEIAVLLFMKEKMSRDTETKRNHSFSEAPEDMDFTKKSQTKRG